MIETAHEVGRLTFQEVWQPQLIPRTWCKLYFSAVAWYHEFVIARRGGGMAKQHSRRQISANTVSERELACTSNAIPVKHNIGQHFDTKIIPAKFLILEIQPRF